MKTEDIRARLVEAKASQAIAIKAPVYSIVRETVIRDDVPELITIIESLLDEIVEIRLNVTIGCRPCEAKHREQISAMSEEATCPNQATY